MKEKLAARPKRTKGTNASDVLASRLRVSLGEVRFSAMLRTITDVVQATPDKRSASEFEIDRLRLENFVRVEANRAVILRDTVSSDEAGRFISRSRPVVVKLAKQGDLLAVEDGRALRFPRWQFDGRTEDGLVPGLRRVLTILDASPYRKAAWLISSNDRLGGRRPIELLREGKVDRVCREATGVTGA